MTKIVKVKAKETKIFEEKEWHKIDIENYGRKIDEYIQKDFYFKAIENNKIVGTIKGKFEMGVIFVAELIVAEKYRGNKLGEKLIKKAIKFGKKYGAHKIYLYTGCGWRSNEFYKKIGFRKTGMLLNHFFNKDFNIYEKLI